MRVFAGETDTWRFVECFTVFDREYILFKISVVSNDGSYGRAGVKLNDGLKQGGGDVLASISVSMVVWVTCRQRKVHMHQPHRVIK